MTGSITPLLEEAEFAPGAAAPTGTAPCSVSREPARQAATKTALMSAWHRRSPRIVAVSALAAGLLTTAWDGSASVFSTGSLVPTARAQSGESPTVQLRADLKSAAEALNKIASVAPATIRAMFAGNGRITSANVLALHNKSIAAQSRLEKAFLAAKDGGALSPEESKEIERLGELAKKTSGPVKADVATLKSVLDLPLVGGETAVRMAPTSQQVAVIKNAEEAKRAVAALLAEIQKMP
jgi:hypothetical protein